MKHTALICAAALAISACTCTCPEKQYTFQNTQVQTQPTSSKLEFLPPSHMTTRYMPIGQSEAQQATIQYRRYTQISYTQPQQPEVIYYPVYQPVVTVQKVQDCSCSQYDYCCC